MSCPLVAGRGVVGDVTGGEGKVGVAGGVAVEVVAAAVCTPAGRTRGPCDGALPIGGAGSADALALAAVPPVPVPVVALAPALAVVAVAAPVPSACALAALAALADESAATSAVPTAGVSFLKSVRNTTNVVSGTTTKIARSTRRRLRDRPGIVARTTPASVAAPAASVAASGFTRLPETPLLSRGDWSNDFGI